MNQPPPTPQKIAQEIMRIKKSLDLIEQEYRWAHNAAYNSGGGSGLDAGHASPSESDATGNAALHASERGGSLRVRGYATWVMRVRALCDMQYRSMRPRPALVERPDAFPPTITPTELGRVHEARMRREARGEGWGIG